MMDEILLEKGMMELSIPPLTQPQRDRFRMFLENLLETNKVMNLTAIKEPDEVVKKHFLDCAGILALLTLPHGAKVIDVGTGAGFPGIPLKILRPDLEITLLDSLNKRINFLNDTIGKLELTGITAIHGRAEEAGQDKKMREHFDYALSRAVASLPVLLELTMPLVAPGGYAVAMKGPEPNDELSEARPAIKKLSGGEAEIMPYKIPFTDITHSLVVVKKEIKTPREFPRAFAQIQKKPL